MQSSAHKYVLETIVLICLPGLLQAQPTHFDWFRLQMDSIRQENEALEKAALRARSQGGGEPAELGRQRQIWADLELNARKNLLAERESFWRAVKNPAGPSNTEQYKEALLVNDFVNYDVSEGDAQGKNDYAIKVRGYGYGEPVHPAAAKEFKTWAGDYTAAIRTDPGATGRSAPPLFHEAAFKATLQAYTKYVEARDIAESLFANHDSPIFHPADLKEYATVFLFGTGGADGLGDAEEEVSRLEMEFGRPALDAAVTAIRSYASIDGFTLAGPWFGGTLPMLRHITALKAGADVSNEVFRPGLEPVGGFLSTCRTFRTIYETVLIGRDRDPGTEWANRGIASVDRMRAIFSGGRNDIAPLMEVISMLKESRAAAEAMLARAPYVTDQGNLFNVFDSGAAHLEDALKRVWGAHLWNGETREQAIQQAKPLSAFTFSAPPPEVPLVPVISIPETPQQPPKRPASGHLVYSGRPVPQNGQVVFAGLPAGNLKLSYDTKLWSHRFFLWASGNQDLILISKKRGLQDHVEVDWQLSQ